MKQMLKVLPLVVSAAFAGTLSANANAGALAQSVLELTNLKFTAVNNDGSLGSALSISDFASLSFADSTSINTQLNGAISANSLGPINSFIGMDIPQLCLGGVCPGENDYSHQMTVSDYLARGDTQLSGSPINVPAQAIVAGADAHTVAEVNLNGEGLGKVTDDINLTAQVTFALNTSRKVGVSFDADAFLIALLEADAQTGSTTKSSLNWSLVLSDESGAVLFQWTPSGAIGANDITDENGATTGTELLDACSLNRTRSATTPNSTSTYACSGSFAAATNFDLVGGTQYTLGISHLSTAEAKFVPEPATLALLGLGLLGLGMSRRIKA